MCEAASSGSKDWKINSKQCQWAGSGQEVGEE